jgi:chromosomal replication initiation ATPase DnaA
MVISYIDVLTHAGAEFDIEPVEIVSSKRNKNLKARKSCMFMMYKFLNFKEDLVAKKFGMRDIRSVFFHIRGMANLYQEDAAYKRQIDRIWANCEKAGA